MAWCSCVREVRNWLVVITNTHYPGRLPAPQSDGPSTAAPLKAATYYAGPVSENGVVRWDIRNARRTERLESNAYTALGRKMEKKRR